MKFENPTVDARLPGNDKDFLHLLINISRPLANSCVC